MQKELLIANVKYHDISGTLLHLQLTGASAALKAVSITSALEGCIVLIRETLRESSKYALIYGKY